MRLSKPVYESLPWLYLLGGALGLGAGYRLHTGAPATLVSLAGLAAIISGIAVWLRRRDYRATRDEYPRHETRDETRDPQPPR